MKKWRWTISESCRNLKESKLPAFRQSPVIFPVSLFIHLNAGLDGQIGIEYKFRDLPILVSLDARPMWDFPGDVNGLGWGGAPGLRYTW